MFVFALMHRTTVVVRVYSQGQEGLIKKTMFLSVTDAPLKETFHVLQMDPLSNTTEFFLLLLD